MSAGDQHTNHFTAADIEKYHKGQLSATEMHAIEKAAMDDPFLADALEGYAVAGVDVQKDLADLKNRLNERTGKAKVVPIKSSRNFNLLRAAVILVFVAGAGLLIYQFGFNKNNKEVALNNSEKKAEAIKEPSTTLDSAAASQDIIVSTDSASTVANGTTTNSATKNNTTITRPGIPSPVRTVTPEKPRANEGIATGNTERGLDLSEDNDDKKLVSSSTKPADARSVNPGMVTPKTEMKERKLADKDEVVVGINEEATQKRNMAARRDADYQQQNNFRGRVTDAENRGVPFANLTNMANNSPVTYTDASGYFNLQYPDSVLRVQVRSIGFENANAVLRNNVSANQVVLKDDRNSIEEVVLSKQTNSSQRKPYDNQTVEEPEPQDGWVKYDAYLLNNLNVPEEFERKKLGSGTVEVSFEVTKNGKPTNLKVEKSLCESCDKEALRLVKEGPKWKRKSKKERTKVTIPFLQ